MVVAPVPVVVAPPGVAVTVHEPELGNPLKSTLPVGVVQSGSVTVPTTGAVGTVGAALMVAFNDATEVQPLLSVTVKVYVFGLKVPKVAVDPVPVCVAPPGDAAIVHDPEAGRLDRSTLPVALVQVGCVMVPIVGLDGPDGIAFIATFEVAPEVQEKELETVNV